MSADIPGLVETSTNVAVITDLHEGDRDRHKPAELGRLGELDEICHTVGSIFELAGREGASRRTGIPAGSRTSDSPILKTANQTYKQLYGKEPAVKAIHAGLECGIIGEKYPGIDMVSFGPTLEGSTRPTRRSTSTPSTSSGRSCWRSWERVLNVVDPVTSGGAGTAAGPVERPEPPSAGTAGSSSS